MNELGFRAIALICLSALGIAVLVTIGGTEKWAFEAVLGLLAAVLGVPPLASWIKSRRCKQ